MISCDVRRLRLALGNLTLKQAEKLTGVSARTIQRWQKAEACPMWFVNLCMLAGGRLDALSATWAGWALQGGYLITPEGDTVTPADIHGLHWMRQQVQEQQRIIRGLESLSQRLRETPRGGKCRVLQGAGGWVRGSGVTENNARESRDRRR